MRSRQIGGRTVTGQHPRYPTVTPYLLYADVAAALEWLAGAFGFRERLRFTMDDGTVNHAEMDVGADGVIMLGNPGPDYRNPADSGETTTLTYVVVDDVDAHFERARDAGAEIVREPAEEVYGDRRYDVKDPAGHLWSFAKNVRDVPPADWGATTPE
jgi:PhnB protein